jgi:K+ transporter
MRADNQGEGGILSLVVLVETLLKKKGGFVLAWASSVPPSSSATR